MKTLEEAIKQLQEAAIVSARFDLRHEQMLNDHAEWLQANDRAAERHDREMQEMREFGRKLDERMDKLAIEWQERGRQIDQRIDKLVLAIGEMIRRSNGK